MQEPLVDDRYFPLVVNVVPEHMTTEHVVPLLAKSEALLKRREPYVTITDVTLAKSLPNPVARKMLADWTKENEALMKRYSLGSAIVITSAIVRGGLTALFWLAPPPYSQQVVATRLEGIDVVRRYWEAAGQPHNDCFAQYRAEQQVLARRADG